ncbi:MAG: hypothetical protein ACXAEF_06365 [Candidatus Thorarchaeota archaeon]|jgi:hypothetical protein
MYDESSIIPLLYYKDVEIYRSDRWTFIEDDWTSGVYGLLNVPAFVHVEIAEAVPTGPALPPTMMIAVVAGAAVVLILLIVVYMKRK